MSEARIVLLIINFLTFGLKIKWQKRECGKEGITRPCSEEGVRKKGKSTEGTRPLRIQAVHMCLIYM